MQNARGEWKSVVKRIYGKNMWLNYQKAEEIIRSLDLNYKKLNIVDCYPGIGVFSAALQNTLKPERHIFFEPLKGFKKFLDSQDQMVSPLDPFRWESFEQEKRYTIEAQPYSQVHDQCLFTANLTHPQGEQLAAQYLNCMYNRSWIFKNGRIRMLLWLRPSTAEKMLAGAGEKFRHRISVHREAVAEARVLVHARPEGTVYSQKSTMPYPSLLEDPLIVPKRDDYSGRNPMSLVEFVPKEHQPQHVDEFEYVVRSLFLTRSVKLEQGLNALGHGAVDALSPKLTDILHKQVYSLDHEDLLRVTQAFWEWPFKPDMLHEFYDDGEIEVDQKKI